MKTRSSHCAAFFNVRIAVASLLCLSAGIISVLAFVAIVHQTDEKRTATSNHWLTRLASTLGVTPRSQPSAKATCPTCAHDANRNGGGASLLIQRPEEREPKGWLPASAVPPYTGPVVD